MHSSLVILAAMSMAVGAYANLLWEVETESTTPIVGGVVIATIAQTNGSSTLNSGTWGGGSAFAGTTVIPNPTIAISTITIKAGNHSALSVTRSGSVMGGVQSNTVCAYLFGFCAISFSTNTGAVGTVTAGAYGIGITVVGQKWTTGVAVASGLTSLGNPLPNVTTTGSFNLTANGHGTIQLAVANKLAISSPAYGLQSTTATPTILRLTFIHGHVPEPGTLLLLGSGVLSLALAGRRRSQVR